MRVGEHPVTGCDGKHGDSPMTLVVTDEHVLGLSPFREHGGAGLAARLAWSRPMLRPNGPHMIQTCRFFGGIYIYILHMHVMHIMHIVHQCFGVANACLL